MKTKNNKRRRWPAAQDWMHKPLLLYSPSASYVEHDTFTTVQATDPGGPLIGDAFWLEGPLQSGVCDAIRDWAHSVTRRTREPAMMVINSPGGDASGVLETIEILRRLAAVRPLEVVAHGYCCSGAYLLTTPAHRFTATPSAMIGGLGTYIAIDDTSKAAERAGVRVIKVSSTELKGAGVDGLPIGDEMIAEIQRIVDRTNSLMTIELLRSRRQPPGKWSSCLTGQAWHAADAKRMGLVDSVGLLEDEIASAARRAETPPTYYDHLGEKQAYERFHRLAASEAGVEYLDEVPEWIENRVAARYPGLAAKVAAHERSERYKDNLYR